MKKLFGLALVGASALGLASCGDDSADINVYTRDTSSGTRDGFFTGIDFSDVKASDDRGIVGEEQKIREELFSESGKGRKKGKERGRAGIKDEG